MNFQSGHTFSEVSEDEEVRQARDFKCNENATVRLYPDGWFFLKTIQKYADRIYNFKIKPTDVFVVTYPKCGTTWTQEIVWTLRNNKDLNNPLAMLPVNVRCPFSDGDYIMDNYIVQKGMKENLFASGFQKLYPQLKAEDGVFLQMAEHIMDPRTIKLHMPLSLAPKNLLDTCKVIYVARNPKDVCVSYHHHCKLIKAHDFVGTMDQFIEYFISDSLLYSPFWNHVKEAWNMRSHPNMHFMFYEDMTANPKKEIESLNGFLETGLTEKQIDAVVEYTSFSAMKARENVLPEDTHASDEALFNPEVVKKDGGFFRKGQVGDFKNKLTKSQEEKIDLWMAANIAGTGLVFKYN